MATLRAGIMAEIDFWQSRITVEQAASQKKVDAISVKIERARDKLSAFAPWLDQDLAVAQANIAAAAAAVVDPTIPVPVP
jgi:hypothetical protein